MSKRTDVKYVNPASSIADQGAVQSEPGKHREPPAWTFGSRVAARQVRAARKAYFRYAEAAEQALNAVETTTTRVGNDLWSIASGTRDALLHLRDPQRAHGRHRHPAVRGSAILKRKIARGRAELRDIALRGQIAADTNVRAYLDHLDALAHAPCPRRFVSVQTSFFWDQWQRSLQQAFDLQQRTVGALRTITSAPTT